MIRRMQRADIDRVANILLDTNIRAHNSILIKRTTTYQKISSCTSFGSLHDKLEAYTQKIKERKHLYHKKYTLLFVTTLIISKKPGNTGISRDIRTEFTTDLLLSD